MPAGEKATTKKPKPEGMESWDMADIPSPESEDEAWGHARRRRTIDTPMDSATLPMTRRERDLSSGDRPRQEGVVSLGTYRRRRMHVLFDPSP